MNAPGDRADAASADAIHAQVRGRYAAIAVAPSSCCGPGSACGGSPGGPCCTPDGAAASLGYPPTDIAEVPPGSNLGLGCGNPTALLGLREGESVLDLGSGGGVDCFLAARRVGPTGHVIGVDMTPEMLERSRKNAAMGGWANVEFRLGEIEHLPVADASVDVVLSNCVVNLVPDQAQVYREALRVLRPGGRLAVADMLATRPIPDAARRDPGRWAGCSSGARSRDEVEQTLRDAGFQEIVVTLHAGTKDDSQLVMTDDLGVVPGTVTAIRPNRS